MCTWTGSIYTHTHILYISIISIETFCFFLKSRLSEIQSHWLDTFLLHRSVEFGVCFNSQGWRTIKNCTQFYECRIKIKSWFAEFCNSRGLCGIVSRVCLTMWNILKYTSIHISVTSVFVQTYTIQNLSQTNQWLGHSYLHSSSLMFLPQN